MGSEIHSSDTCLLGDGRFFYLYLSFDLSAGAQPGGFKGVS